MKDSESNHNLEGGRGNILNPLHRKKWPRPRRQPRPRLPYGTAIWHCHMALPYGSAIWLCHMALPHGFAMWLCHIQDFGRRLKSDVFQKKWDLFQLSNIGLVTHDDVLKISIWPRVDKLVLTTPRGSRYDFYAQLNQNLWPSRWKSGKNVKLCQNGLQKNVFWLLRSSLGSVFDFKSI